MAKWYVFSGSENIHESKVLINFERSGFLEKSQYFEARYLGKHSFLIISPGTTRWKKEDHVKILFDKLLDTYQTEKDAAKNAELVFQGYKDPTGREFSDTETDQYADVGLTHK